MDWNSKYIMSEQNRTMSQFYALQKRFKEPTKVADVVEDNLLRLTLLYGVERHITVRQAYGSLKTRFLFGDSNM